MANLDPTRLLRKVGMANLDSPRLLRKVGMALPTYLAHSCCSVFTVQQINSKFELDHLMFVSLKSCPSRSGHIPQKLSSSNRLVHFVNLPIG